MLPNILRRFFCLFLWPHHELSIFLFLRNASTRFEKNQTLRRTAMCLWSTVKMRQPFRWQFFYIQLLVLNVEDLYIISKLALSQLPIFQSCIVEIYDFFLGLSGCWVVLNAHNPKWRFEHVWIHMHISLSLESKVNIRLMSNL